MESCFKCSCKCKRCDEIMREFNFMKESESKLKIKVNELSLQIKELITKNQLLEQQNKMLLENCSTPIKVSQNDDLINKSEVTKIIGDFGEIFQKQGNDISRLAYDRDRLASVALSSLKTIDKQSFLLNHYNKLVNLLLFDYEPRNAQNFSLIQSELCTLHINYTQKTAFNFYEPQKDLSNSYSSSSMQRILSMIGNNQYQRIVCDYLIDQDKQLVEAKKKSSEYFNRIKEVYKVLEVTGKNHSFAIKKIKRAMEEAKGASNAYKFVRELVTVCVSFADQYFDDKHVKKCVGRINKWLNDGDRTINVIQEVDFLLGLCYPLSSQKKFI